MTHNIIKTENYLLVVDDSDIKEGKTLLSKRGIIHTNIGWNYGDKVIIAHLPLNNSPVLEGVSLLPPLEDEQSLQQPKMPVGFECEDEYVHDDTVPYPKTLGTHPKTIVNPQGQTVLVGKYIY
jgi:hypothetical protein